MFFFILITTVLGLVLISWEEILSWSLVRAEGWSSLGQQSRLLNYPRCHLMRLKNDKILKEVYWSVERFKNDLWKLNIVPLELSFSPEVFAVAVMLWRLKCQVGRPHPGLGNTWDPSSSKMKCLPRECLF